MKKVLIFSGTTEGRKLAETLASAGIPAVVCVATEYGKEVMPELPGITVHQGRMDTGEMRLFMADGTFLAVVDATHPFATEVSKNIKGSAGETGLPYFRLKRETKGAAVNDRSGMETGAAVNDRSGVEAGAIGKDGVPWRDGASEKPEFWFSDSQTCADALKAEISKGGAGNILLTTGSKELSVYCADPELKKRLYVRVLPGMESLSLCKKEELEGRQILALQGPFSEEMNLAFIHAYDIRYLVTKESGITGGFPEKAAAAARAGITLCVIGNPEKEDGMTFLSVCRRLEELTGIQIPVQNELKIVLAGAGMGGKATLTAEAEKAIASADYLFGAKRLLMGLQAKKEALPYYLAEDIIPVLSDALAQAAGETLHAVILFSGDSGFYSGCEKLYQKLTGWKEERKEKISIRIQPGISSVSCFASACGMNWQDAKIVSIHGKGGRDAWEAEVLEAVRYHKKTFLLVSGAKDVRELGAVLKEAGLSDCTVKVGYQLSYPEEQIYTLRPEDCKQFNAEGLYICAVLHDPCEQKYLAPDKADDAFIRGKVPMTKEEIREVAVSKLHLTEEAIAYDIGSGTGSIAVEIAARAANIRVFAVEQKEEAIELIYVNREKFHAKNITVIHGKAPEALKELPAPTHAFIGGSSGNLCGILNMLKEKNPHVRVVITAISLETVAEITALIKEMQIGQAEVVALQVSRAKAVGDYHLMQAENPVYLCTIQM